MNSMCNLTKFILSSPTLGFDTAFLVQLFVSDVIMIIGMCSVVIIDDGFTFKSVLIGMCISLNIHHWCISMGNLRDNLVECYHRLWNKTQAIDAECQDKLICLEQRSY